jgi:hypothetical protein
MRIMDELTLLAPHTDQTKILPLDDPELFNYPVARLPDLPPDLREQRSLEAAHRDH